MSEHRVLNVERILLTRGTTAQNQAYTGRAGELIMDTETNTVRLHDGVTQGGHALAGGTSNFDGQFSSLTGTPTTLAGYGITNAYTQAEVDAAIATVTSGHYTDADVAAYLNGNLNTSIIPDTNETYDLGSATNKFRDLYLSGTTIHLGDQLIQTDEQNRLLWNGNHVSDYNNLVNTPTLATVATTGSYNDLTNLPTLFDGAFASLTGAPTTLAGYGITDAYTQAQVDAAIATVTAGHFDGDYNSLTNLPTLFSGAYADLTGSPTIPADVSDLTDTTNLLSSGGLENVVEDTTPQLGGALDLNGNNITGTGDINITGDITASGDINATVNGFEIGYRNIPQVVLSVNATLQTSDSGKHYYSTLGTNTTLTIPPNSSAAFEIGAAINIINNGAGEITIAEGAGVTLNFAGTSATGNRTVTAYGAATLQKVATNTWFLVGVGVN